MALTAHIADRDRLQGVSRIAELSPWPNPSTALGRSFGIGSAAADADVMFMAEPPCPPELILRSAALRQGFSSNEVQGVDSLAVRDRRSIHGPLGRAAASTWRPTSSMSPSRSSRAGERSANAGFKPFAAVG